MYVGPHQHRMYNIHDKLRLVQLNVKKELLGSHGATRTNPV